MPASLNTAQVQTILSQTFASALSAEKALAGDAQAQLQQLAAELAPLALNEAIALQTAANPAVQSAYLAVLEGCLAAAIARLGLAALQTQRQLLTQICQTVLQVLVVVLKAA